MRGSRRCRRGGEQEQEGRGGEQEEEEDAGARAGAAARAGANIYKTSFYKTSSESNIRMASTRL